MTDPVPPTPAPPALATSWSGQVSVRLSKAETWELLWRREGQRRWLGADGHIDFDTAARSVLADEAGVWRTARTGKVKSPDSLLLIVEPSPRWMTPAETRLTVRLVANDEDDRTTVVMEESGVPAAYVAEVARFWRGRLGRISRLGSRVRERRESVRQAVVIIHGIGEQQPGETLTSFLKSGVLSAEDSERDMWVKPDHFSDSFELRRVTLKSDGERPTTDVYEFYWAHVIQDTTLGQVADWLQRLLFRWRVPPPIRPLWLLAWLLIVAVTAAFGASALGYEVPLWVKYGSAMAAVAGVAWQFLGKPLAVNFIGDAARYLRPKPANIEHRQAIRQAGVSLIEKLHDSGRYDRIVLVGHSLGSVIAYDIVTHAWVRMHQEHRRPTSPAFAGLIAVERALADGVDVSQVQAIQHAAWCQQRINTQRWLVTDLVTAGSPLTYADFLIGDSVGVFEDAKANRVLPTCPPGTELQANGHRRMTFDKPYRDPLTGRTRTFTVFHHGAPFAVTRWTNLYFRTRWLGLAGDVIGGPVAPKLGAWVKDVPLESPGLGFMHTRYWRAVAGKPEHLQALRSALQLDARNELLDLQRAIPAFALIESPDE